MQNDMYILFQDRPKPMSQIHRMLSRLLVSEEKVV